MTEIIVAAIAATGGFAGAAVTAWAQGRKTQQQIQTAQAVTDTKLETLAREVREHNNFARRMPVVEEQIKVINHRIGDLEKLHARE